MIWRGRSAVRSILCLVLLVSASGAQLLTDDPNDVAFETLNGTVVAGPLALMDLLSLDAADGDLITFTITFQDLQPNSIPYGMFAKIGFQYKDMEYLIETELGLVPSNLASDTTWLYREAGAAVWLNGGHLGTAVVVEGLGGTIQVSMEKIDILDRHGRGAREGDFLESLWMEASDRSGRYHIVGPATTGTVGRLRDFAPDTGESDNLVMTASPGALPVDVVTDRQLQYSNGEAGTFLFHSNMTVYESYEALQIRVLEGPENWFIEPSQSIYEVGNEGEVAFVTVVGIEGRHSHGETHNITMGVETLNGELLTTFPLQIRLTDFPLPAGHHDTLWIHTLEPSGSIDQFYGKGKFVKPFMSTIEESSRATNEYIAPTEQSIGIGTTLGWCIPLRTAMHLGMDFTEENGEIRLQFTSDLPLEGTMQGRLMFYKYQVGSDRGQCKQTDALELAQIEAKPIAVDRDTVADYSASITASLDRVRPTGASLYLELELVSDNPVVGLPVDSIRMVPGGSLQLPLDDYSSSEQIPSALDIHIESAELTRKPGQVAAFYLQINTPGTYEVSAGGGNVSKGIVKDGEEFQVYATAGENDSHIVVKVDGQQSGLALLSLRSDENCDCSSDEITFDEAKESPVAAFGAIVALLGVAVRKLRR